MAYISLLMALDLPKNILTTPAHFHFSTAPTKTFLNNSIIKI